MSRVIKFRAFLKENHSGKEQMFYQGDQYLQSFLNRCARFSNAEGRDHEKYGNYELMQFTGLHDKDGKEIYDGDILKVSNMEFSHFQDSGVPDSPTEIFEDYNGEVSFDCGQFEVDGHSLGTIPLSALDIMDIEVIGNIHQNPELLESKAH